MQSASIRMNDSGTRTDTSAESVQPCSLIVLARQLVGQRSKMPPQMRPLISTLAQQIYNFDANPEAMRPKILATLDLLSPQPETAA